MYFFISCSTATTLRRRQRCRHCHFGWPGDGPGRSQGTGREWCRQRGQNFWGAHRAPVAQAGSDTINQRKQLSVSNCVHIMKISLLFQFLYNIRIVIDAPYLTLAVSTSTMSTWCSTPPRWSKPLTCATRRSGRLERFVNAWLENNPDLVPLWTNLVMTEQM